ncbi:MAG: glyoxalase [Ponticaulis sp.]|nr:glyoxalase [Ponticaulis sp.]
MAKVIGLGGLFLHSADVAVTKAWYRKVMGFDGNDYGGWDFLHADAGKAFPNGARSIFAMFEKQDYFQPSTLPFMLNLMVDDLDGILERLKAEGIEECQPAESHSYGKFAWLMDPDGRKVELWQPIEMDESAQLSEAG